MDKVSCWYSGLQTHGETCDDCRHSDSCDICAALAEARSDLRIALSEELTEEKQLELIQKYADEIYEEGRLLTEEELREDLIEKGKTIDQLHKELEAAREEIGRLEFPGRAAKKMVDEVERLCDEREKADLEKWGDDFKRERGE